MAAGMGTFTSNLDGHGDETNFFSDNSTYVVSLDADAEAQLVTPVPMTAKADPKKPTDFYTTIFYSDKRFKLPAGVDAYVATIDGSNMNMAKVVNAGEILPENKAFVLKSNIADYTLVPYGIAAVSVTETNHLCWVQMWRRKSPNWFLMAKLAT